MGEEGLSRITELPYLKNVHTSVSTEELKKYDPQLALTFNRPNELKQLAALDIPAVYGVTSQSLGDVKKQLSVYAQAVAETLKIALRSMPIILTAS